jgi:iron complex outermembrane receptor protein
MGMGMIDFKDVIRVGLLTSASVLIPVSAYAQSNASEPATSEAATPPQSGRIQEIIVTARRQSESQQKVPVAVTSLDSAALTTAQVTEIADLQRTAPGIVIATGSPSASGFALVAIRGQGQLDAATSVDPKVATYIDGVYIARPSQGQVGLFDLDSAQILRGPQGTLFGRNTTGGAIVLTTVDPQKDFSVKATAGYGNYDEWSAAGVVNVPLGEQFAFRIGYEHRQHDGYGRNPILDRPANDLKSDALRAKLRWDAPGGDFSAILAGDYNRQSDHGQQLLLSSVNPQAGAGGPPFSLGGPLAPFIQTSSNFYDTYSGGWSANANFVNPAQRPADALKTYGGSLTLNGRIGSLDVKSISAYRYSNNVGFIDLDGTPVPLLASESGYKSQAYSEELQVSGDISSKIKFISGLYWSHEKAREYSLFQAFGFAKDGAAPVPPTVNGYAGPGTVINGYVGLNDGDVFNDTFGIYAQGYLQITDKLRASAGLRWTFDQRKVQLHNLNVVGAPGNAGPYIAFGATGAVVLPNCAIVPDSGNLANCTQTETAKFNYPAYTAVLDYQAAEGLFVYAKTSRAAHSGGFNLRVGSVPAFSPDTLTDVEFGFKADMLDRHLRVNLDVFHSWGKKTPISISKSVNGVSTQYLANAGDEQIDGIEAEIIARPWRGMELNGNMALFEGSYDRGTYVDLLGDHSQSPLIQLPHFQFNVGGTQTVPMGRGNLILHLDYSHVSSQFYGYELTTGVGATNGAATANQLFENPGYGVLNGRVAFHFEDTGVELALWGRNLTGKQYNVNTFANLYTSLGVATNYAGEPRTYGFTVSYKFGGK